jgi:hypothetical protein
MAGLHLAGCVARDERDKQYQNTPSGAVQVLNPAPLSPPYEKRRESSQSAKLSDRKPATNESRTTSKERAADFADGRR